MTAREAIDRADALLPNAVPEAEKLRLLAELDGRLREEAADLRGDEPPAAPVCTAASPLWLAAPWESLYLHWLQAEILYFQAEYGRYENARAQFNSLYLSWHAALIRGARPRGNGNLRF